MAAFHASAGYGLLALMGIYTLGNLLAWRTARRFGGLEWLLVLIVVAMVAQSLQGTAMLLADQRPSEWLHFVYTVASLVALLGARGLALVVSATHERFAIAAGSAIATVLLARVAATG